jgi:hypothetical protein
MKYIKIILLSCVILFVLLINNDLYVNELSNFDSVYFENSDISGINNIKEKEDFLDELDVVCKKYDVGFFVCVMHYNDNRCNELDIYANDKAIKKIPQKFPINQTTYNSLFSGSVSVAFHNLTDLKDDGFDYVYAVSFTDNTVEVYNELCNRFDMSIPDYNGSSEGDVLLILWIIVCLLIVLFALESFISSRKKLVVKIIYGENLFSIIIKNILNEIITDLIILLGGYLVARLLVNGFWLLPQMAISYFIVVVFVSTLYINLINVDIRASINNVNGQKAFLTFLRIFKLVIFSISVFGISTTVSTLSGLSSEEDSKLLMNYKNYTFINLRGLKHFNLANESEMDDYLNYYYDCYNNLYKSYYTELKPVFSCKVLDDLENNSYVLANYNANNIIADFCSKSAIDFNYDDYDVVIFINEKAMDDESLKYAYQNIYDCYQSPENLSVEIVEYYKDSSIIIFDPESQYGYEQIDNPIVTWLRDKDYYFDINISDYICGKILYVDKFDDVALLSENEIYENGYEISFDNFYTLYKYKRNIILSILKAGTSVSVVLGLLNFIISIIAISLDYKVNSKEKAILLMMGYSIAERNKSIAQLSIIEMIILIIMKIGFKIINLNGSIYLLKIGAFFIALDICISILNILKCERANINRILKNGI